MKCLSHRNVCCIWNILNVFVCSRYVCTTRDLNVGHVWIRTKSLFMNFVVSWRGCCVCRWVGHLSSEMTPASEKAKNVYFVLAHNILMVTVLLAGCQLSYGRPKTSWRPMALLCPIMFLLCTAWCFDSLVNAGGWSFKSVRKSYKYRLTAFMFRWSSCGNICTYLFR